MSSLVEDHLVATMRARFAVDGVTCSYLRGDDRIDGLKALKSGSKFDQQRFDPLSGGYVEIGFVETVDFTFLTEDLVLSGVRITPVSGDRILWRVGDEMVTHEVLPVGDEPASRHDDRYQRITLVHTKEFDREDY